MRGGAGGTDRPDGARQDHLAPRWARGPQTRVIYQSIVKATASVVLEKGTEIGVRSSCRLSATAASCDLGRVAWNRWALAANRQEAMEQCGRSLCRKLPRRPRSIRPSHRRNDCDCCLGGERETTLRQVLRGSHRGSENTDGKHLHRAGRPSLGEEVDRAAESGLNSLAGSRSCVGERRESAPRPPSSTKFGEIG
jgi:hypothetical protein